MTSPQLDAKDVALMRSCMDFVARTPALQPAFETRLGVDSNDFAKILLRWPEGIENPEWTPTTIAINNALNEIIHGLQLSSADFHQIGSSRGAVQAMFFRWATVRGLTAEDLR